jgi:hypothetical protein
MVKVYPFKGDMNKMADENKGLKADIKGVNMEDPYPNGFKSGPAHLLQVQVLFYIRPKILS